MVIPAIRMGELHVNGKYRQPGKLVLDVRSRTEYRRGHVPGSRNIPVDELTRDPHRFGPSLEPYDEVYVHCSSGHRARRAYEALRHAGLGNVVHVQDSGMPQWIRQHYPVEREISLARDVVTGLVAGLLADVAVSQVDRALGRFVSDEQRRRERAVREGSPHEVGGRKIGEKLTGRTFSEAERRKAQIAFTIGYGLLWGAIYALVRRRQPRVTALLGLPYAGAFFLACDGLLAPLFKLSPGLGRTPWQFNAKEMANHIAWTGAAEIVHRGAESVVLAEPETTS
jgi:rhodanese-related sulfurtransferase/uncharacterized membrane protein YagU involved in acid resistance